MTEATKLWLALNNVVLRYAIGEAVAQEDEARAGRLLNYYADVAIVVWL